MLNDLFIKHKLKLVHFNNDPNSSQTGCDLLLCGSVRNYSGGCPNTTTQPYILVDAGSGAILAGNNPHQRWYPASLTKLMSAYVTFLAIRDGELEGGSPVVISKNAARQPASKMGYKSGTRLRVDAALKILIIKSANDVSVALGEAVAGSVENFVARMNLQARRLGMTNTQFANPSGLHSVRQYSSARDMALLSIRILEEFPQYAPWFAATAFKAGEKTYNSYNLLLENFKGANGMKTGFVCAAGFNMVASAKRGGRTLIAVVLGESSQGERAIAAAKLLSEGFKGSRSASGSVYQAPRPVPSNKPKNMRPILCTKEARAARYDPAGGKAEIKSKYLTPAKSSGGILLVSTGGVDAKPGKAFQATAFMPTGKVPTPTPRPTPGLQ